MADVKVISNDNDVLEYSELFKIRDRLEQHLKDGIETTFIRQMDRGDGKISMSIFSVHTLKGDAGFTCLIFPDKAQQIKDIEEFLLFKQKMSGIKCIKDDGSMDDDIVGQS